MAPARPSRTRVLLVANDTSICSLVSAALDASAVELIICRAGAEARRSLHELAPALVLLDMTLPDDSGMPLLQDAQLRRTTPATQWVVFHSGLSPAAHAELPALGVRQALAKPFSQAALLDCVTAALAAVSAPLVSPVNPGTPSARPAHVAPLDGSAEAEAAAIRDYFENDRPLFEMMKARSIAQFPHDLRAGEAAMAAVDGLALRRVAHGLKSVLRMLGHPAAADLALSLEQAVEMGDRATWPALWQALRDALERLGAESAKLR